MSKKYTILFLLVLYLSAPNIIGQIKYHAKYKTNAGDIVIENYRNSFTADSRISIVIEQSNNIIEKTFEVIDDYVDTTWVTDFDNDLAPEIIIVTRSTGSGAYAKFYFIEYENNNLIIKNIPELNPKTLKFYGGHDNFLITNTELIREFPVYLEGDSNAGPSGGRVKVIYKYENDVLRAIITDYDAPSGKEGFKILIKSANELPKVDSFSKPDCFIEVYVGEQFWGRTSVIQNDNSPYFNQSIDVPTYDNQNIRFDIYDEDISKNNYIGSVTILKPKAGVYPIRTEYQDGSIRKNGELEVEFIKSNKE